MVAMNTAAEATASLRRRRLVRSDRLLLLLPIAVLYGLLMLAPLSFIVETSFSAGLDHYRGALASPVLWWVIENTVVISATTTLVALILAYAYAAALWRAKPILKVVLLGLVLLPFWTGVLVKNFAWAALLQDNGVILDLLRALGFDTGGLSLLHNRFAVIVGMVHYVLPYAVFPIYATLIAIDWRLVRAAQSLGASLPRAIWNVILPLSLPGVLAAGLLVFIVSTGFFITPIILGSPRDMMIANLVDFYAHQIVDFGAAASLAMLVIAAVSILVIAYQRVPKEGQYGSL
jgi:ABC-type spermidine/putrescine transport system permease subunit I